MTDAERNRIWRQNNPDKIKVQRERRRLRKLGLLPPEVKPTPEERAARNKAKAIEYNRRYREAHKGEIQEKQRGHWRRYYRLRKGIPLDAPPKVRKYATEEERREAKRAAARRAAAKKRGTTVEEIEARKLAAIAARAEKKRLDAIKAEECKAQRAQRLAEQRAAAERAKRQAAPVVKQPVAKPAPVKPPVNANDPPELIELFRKASKGQPAMPYNPRVRKLSVFHLRGAR